MAITVNHSTPADGSFSATGASAWDANHTLTNVGTMAEQNANAVAITSGTATLTSVTTPIVQATNSAGLALRNSGGTTQISMGAGGGDNFTVAVSTNLNGTNAQIDISPTGTGHVHIKPTGVNSVEIAPTFVGEMDNVTIGATTAAAGSFTNLSVTGTTSFDGSQGTAGQVLTSAGTGATPTWATPTTGTVTSIIAGTGLSGGTITTTGTIAIDSTVATLTGTQTLTNKRVNPRAVAAGSTSGTLTPNGDTTDVFNAFGLTGAITMAAPSGTPVDGQRLMLRFEDNGTGRGITWTTSSGAYRAVGVTLPTTTVASKVTYVGCVYNSTDVFWDVIAVATQA